MKNLAWMGLECWNAAISVGEGKNVNQHLSSTDDKKSIYGRTWKFENWSST